MKRLYDKKIMEIEKLFQKAFARFKDRYLNFLIVTVLGWGIGLGIALIFGVGVGSVIVTWIVAKNTGGAVAVGVVVGLLAIAALVYLTSWVQLATIDSLIQSKKISPFETYKKVRPLVKDYIVFAVLMFLFFIGLLPLTLLSLFVVGVLWALWSIFAAIVFLEKKKKGLENLWISRAMVNQKFWPVAGVALLVLVLVIIVSGLFASTKNSFANPLVSQLLITPFVMSLYYEMYKSLKAPEKVKGPRVWIALSVAGFIVSIVLTGVVVTTAAKIIPEIIQDKTLQQELYKELQKSSSENEM